MRDRTAFACTLALALCAQSALANPVGWQCATIGKGASPAIAQSAAGYLERAGRVYPSQLLGVVSAGGRVYLVNANDGGWSERVRQGLMELRLAEPDITAARRFQATVSGTADVEIPAGDYVCLAYERAGRHGLMLTGRGGIQLASGKSVYLVDPHEGAIVVEVKAVGSQPLDFREILALSGRSGIYAGLAGKRPQPDPATRRPGDAIIVALGPAGRHDAEIVITPRPQEAGEKLEERPVIAAAAIEPAQPVPAPPPARDPPVQTARVGPPAAPAPEKPAPREAAPAAAPAPAPPVVEAPPVRVARADPPAAPASVQPLPPEVPPVAVVAVAEPVRIPSSAAKAPQAAGGQSYEDYARAMKTMLALRRSGGVRSVSEMTYVHPAIEDLRARR